MHSLLIALPLVGVALANEDGITGFARTGCTDCHGTLPSDDVAVVLAARSGAVQAGETLALQLRVASADPLHRAAGLDVEASDGSLVPAPTMLLRKGELTHQYPHALDDGVITFDFEWTAPAYAGEVTLWASANAVDQDAWTSGDGWNRTWLSLMVESDCLDQDGDDVGDCEGDCDDLDDQIFPGAPDTWYDGVDSDCAGDDDHDQDGDGVPVDADCDDTDASRSAPEDCAPTDSGDADGGAEDGGTDETGASEQPSGGCSVAAGGATGLLALLPALAGLRRRRPGPPRLAPRDGRTGRPTALDSRRFG